jgi:hypothetical protein
MDYVFTPTQKRILAVLGDGKLHATSELMACLKDEMQPPAMISQHLNGIRRALRPEGKDVIYQRGEDRISYYRLVRLAAPNSE